MTARAVLQQADITRALTRISHEILESNRGAAISSSSASPRAASCSRERIAAIIEPHRARRRRAVGALDVTMYRDDLGAHPHPHAAARPQVPGRRHRRQDRRARRRRALLGPHHPRRARRARRPRPRRARCASPCSSTAATASCRSAPTSSARTCRARRASASTCASPRSTATTPSRSTGATSEAPALAPATSRATTRSRILDVAEDMADVRDREVQEAADPARQDRREPLLRGLHPHPHLLRGRGEAALRRRHQLQREGLERLEGREPQGHRADARRDGRRRRRHPPPRLRARRACSRRAAGSTPASSTRATARTSTRRRRCSTRSRSAAGCTATASRGRGLDGVRVTIVGDILHSRVARSNVWLLTTLGAEVDLVAPAHPAAGRAPTRWPVDASATTSTRRSPRRPTSS